MKIRDILQKDRPTISFEVFPPKTMDNYASVEKATMKIAELQPDFMSITYGAGGGTSAYTIDIAANLMKTYNKMCIRDRGQTGHRGQHRGSTGRYPGKKGAGGAGRAPTAGERQAGPAESP